MARRYSGSRGKSSSTKPSKKVKPVWVRYKKKEVELLIQKLAKEGKSSSQIGIVLRDSYGIPDVEMFIEKPMMQLLREKKLVGEIPEDLLAIIRRSVILQKHFESNKQDMSAFRGIQLSKSKIARLVKYYKRIGRLPANWKYDTETIKMHAE